MSLRQPDTGFKPAVPLRTRITPAGDLPGLLPYRPQPIPVTTFARRPTTPGPRGITPWPGGSPAIRGLSATRSSRSVPRRREAEGEHCRPSRRWTLARADPARPRQARPVQLRSPARRRGQVGVGLPRPQGDRRNLSIATGTDGAVLLRCHHVDDSGQSCTAAAIVAALDIELRHLFVPVPGSKQVAPAKSKKKRAGAGFDSPRQAAEFLGTKLGAKPSGHWVYREADGAAYAAVYPSAGSCPAARWQPSPYSSSPRRARSSSRRRSRSSRASRARRVAASSSRAALRSSGSERPRSWSSTRPGR